MLGSIHKLKKTNKDFYQISNNITTFDTIKAIILKRLFMSASDKLKTALQVVQDAGLIDEVEPDEVVQFADEIGENDYNRIAKTIAYIRKRTTENASMYDAFKHAFPERCVVQNEAEAERWGGSKKVGDELGRTTIEIKAKRLEQSRLYKYIITALHTSVYTIFALERVRALQYAFEKSMDESVKDRDRVEYLKTFLQETRKPEKSGFQEINVNIQNNEISIATIEDKMKILANKLNGSKASEIIDVLEVEDDNK